VNRTRLAQLAAVLGAAVLLVLAVAVDQLYELNRDVIGDDPGLILPGQVFELPDW
jgi:nucleoid-associated protein YgaU